MSYILNFDQISQNDIDQVGGKNASLGEMIRHLTQLGIKVPSGFALTTLAYTDFLQLNGLDEKIYPVLAQLNISDIDALKCVSREIRQWILEAKLPTVLESDIRTSYQSFFKSTSSTVAVRSSATAEDLPNASFAGQQETYLNINGIDNILSAIKQVYASLFTERAISYRVNQGFPHQNVAISVGIQQMIRSDLGASGVAFTLDTESGFDQVILITATYGLGEALVQGKINPDEFYVHKPTLNENKPSIISRTLGSKMMKMIYAESTSPGRTIQSAEVSEVDRLHFCLTDQDILTIAKQTLLIENHYHRPMDIEWGKDGLDGKIYILQARPETVVGHKNHHVIEQYILQEKKEVITQGRSIGQRIGHGVARLITHPQQMNLMQDGEILVTDMTDPDWEPIMKRAAAIVTNRGGRTCHAAIVARELGIPAVVGCTDATQKINPGETITVSCAEGESGYVYAGFLSYEIKKTEIDRIPALPFHICMNLANPEQAFNYQFLPNDGVGLARLEFIISNRIGIHPNACLRYNELPEELKKEVGKRTLAYNSPIEFYIEKLCEGIATIAAAFYPKPVIVRFSDFKSNEYANLLGGMLFEPQEENPMIGFRGGSRYLSKHFSDCFILECEAIKRARNRLGLLNVQVMFPFVRTVEEAKQLIELLKSQGLERGKDQLKVYMMCEIPSNALLAEEFLAYFDGFSIGSNDLTQLTLGLDRDSELIAPLFDERDPAVKILLQRAIMSCKKMGKYVGICGQGPSDHTDFAQWLMDQGISSISLSPDSIVRTWLTLGNHTNNQKKNFFKRLIAFSNKLNLRLRSLSQRQVKKNPY